MDWLKYKKIYFTVSLTLIVVSLLSILTWGLKLSIDFRGGSIIEYRLLKDLSSDEIRERIERQSFEVNSIQKTQDENVIVKLQHLSNEDKDTVTKAIEGSIKTQDEEATPSASIGNGQAAAGSITELLRFEAVGPSIGPELVQKTAYAIILAALGILLWVAYQFKSFKFGTSAILAMFHDTLILVGSFSILGHFYGAEVDFLFVTAVLTTLSFSVHDTIVVFDRIREIQGKEGGMVGNIANRALSETMVRSLNNSFTIIFMLVALLLLGGSTIKWFAAALLIGTILGTYSSPFVAVPLLVTWDEVSDKINLKSKAKELFKRK